MKEAKQGRPALFTDEQVEVEIDRLLNSDTVRLAKKEKRIRDKRRQYMYQLRALEKRGRELEAMGITMENMREELFGTAVDDDE